MAQLKAAGGGGKLKMIQQKRIMHKDVIMKILALLYLTSICAIAKSHPVASGFHSEDDYLAISLRELRNNTKVELFKTQQWLIKDVLFFNCLEKYGLADIQAVIMNLPTGENPDIDVNIYNNGEIQLNTLPAKPLISGFIKDPKDKQNPPAYRPSYKFLFSSVPTADSSLKYLLFLRKLGT